MDQDNLKNTIDDAFDKISNVSTDTKGEVREAVEETLNLLDTGKLRVAEPIGSSKWKVNQWAKKAVLLSFRLNNMEIIQGGPESWDCGPSVWWDKVKSKFSNWSSNDFLIKDKIPLTVTTNVTQGNDTITCPGDQVVLDGAYSSGQGIANGWWGTDTTGSSQLTVTPLSTTTYYYSAIDECMIQAIVDSVTIYLQGYDSLETVSENPDPICPGSSVQILSEAKKGTPPYSFQWDNGPNDSSWTITPSNSDWYSFEVTDGCGSVAKDSVWVTVAPFPIAAFNYSPNSGSPLSVQFNNQSSDTNYVKWYFGDGSKPCLPKGNCKIHFFA